MKMFFIMIKRMNSVFVYFPVIVRLFSIYVSGTRQEFSNMFERPILNGQCVDSTPEDIRLMRYRSHVLHSLLEGFVQR